MEVYNVTLLGHKDHGKSTLIGSLLLLTKSVTQTRINEAKEYSRRLHKSFEPAFILDSFHEEREGGLTIDTTRAEVLYKGMAFSFIDVPGHEELIDNMISGASYANTAILLVSAKKSEGIKDQTKRHLFISRMLGIENLIVAVNKMDLAGFSQKKFENIKGGLSGFIRQIGFKEKNVLFIPISAHSGENIIEQSGKMSWYKGKPLLDALKEMVTGQSKANEGKALRIALQGFLGGRKDILLGRVIKGRIKAGEKNLRIVPLDKEIQVKAMVVGGKRVKVAKKGDSVALEINKEIEQETRGAIICSDIDCVESKDTIKARLFLTKPLRRETTIRFNGVEMKFKIKPLEYIDPVTGKMYKKGIMKPLGALDAELKLFGKIPAEKFEDTQELGRFALYANKNFAGIGIIV
ncbi:MAG: GTP-binding protein [Candidatus Micrarchaeia archaeon]